jgi:hypothetical protein
VTCRDCAMPPKRKSATTRVAQDAAPDSPDRWDPPPQEPPAYTSYAGPLQAGSSNADMSNIAQTVDSLRQSDLWLWRRMGASGNAVAPRAQSPPTRFQRIVRAQLHNHAYMWVTVPCGRVAGRSPDQRGPRRQQKPDHDMKRCRVARACRPT